VNYRKEFIALFSSYLCSCSGLLSSSLEGESDRSSLFLSMESLVGEEEGGSRFSASCNEYKVKPIEFAAKTKVAR
jgi:hypothetical protein